MYKILLKYIYILFIFNIIFMTKVYGADNTAESESCVSTESAAEIKIIKKECENNNKYADDYNKDNEKDREYYKNIIIDNIKKEQKRIIFKDVNVSLNTQYFKEIFKEIKEEYVELFYANLINISDKEENNIVMIIDYTVDGKITKDNGERSSIYKDKIDDEVEKIKSLIINCESKIEIESEIVKYLHNNCKFKEKENSFNDSVYGCLVNKKATSLGFAKTVNYLLSQYNIESGIVQNLLIGGNYSWNYVVIDGEYYELDAAWNKMKNIEFNYNAFNASSEKMNQIHKELFHRKKITYSNKCFDNIIRNKNTKKVLCIKGDFIYILDNFNNIKTVNYKNLEEKIIYSISNELNYENIDIEVQKEMIKLIIDNDIIAININPEKEDIPIKKISEDDNEQELIPVSNSKIVTVGEQKSNIKNNYIVSTSSGSSGKRKNNRKNNSELVLKSLKYVPLYLRMSSFFL